MLAATAKNVFSGLIKLLFGNELLFKQSSVFTNDCWHQFARGNGVVRTRQLDITHERFGKLLEFVFTREIIE